MTHALVTGVLTLLFWLDTIVLAVTSVPTMGVVTLPEPAPGASVSISCHRYERQPWVKPPWTGPKLKPRPAR